MTAFLFIFNSVNDATFLPAVIFFPIFSSTQAAAVVWWSNSPIAARAQWSEAVNSFSYDVYIISIISWIALARSGLWHWQRAMRGPPCMWTTTPQRSDFRFVFLIATKSRKSFHWIGHTMTRRIRRCQLQQLWARLCPINQPYEG